jgi:ubiquinone/menaquinone biosynthesis C-methylase UbiE
MEKSASKNSDRDTFRICDMEKLPLESNTVDMIVCKFVVEHLKNPIICFGEFSRVLKGGGGLVIIVTPNTLHYTSIITRLSPYWFHRWYCQKRGWDPDDVYPVYYRANRREKLVPLMHQVGLQTAHINMVEGSPGYLDFSLIPFLIGIVYERIVTRFAIKDLHCSILAIFKKH